MKDSPVSRTVVERRLFAYAVLLEKSTEEPGV